MSSRTVVHLVRHGEVENPQKILYGRLPGYHLSDAGTVMAKRAAAWFIGRDIAAVVSSPLERAVETATPIAEQFDLPIRQDASLTEAANHFEGRTFGVGDGALKHPGNWVHIRNPFRPSWGEPYEEIAARMFAAVARARDSSSGHEAVCVSHQLPIWIVRRKIERKRLWHDPRRRQCALGSITSLVFEGANVVEIRYEQPSGAAGAGQVGGA